jgi:hypothetical protein
MICNSPSIIKENPCEDCPKLEELGRVLDESLSEDDVKVIVFSEWEKMLAKVRSWADRNGIDYAWHTGSVPQKRRRAEILAFRDNPGCRLFLSTDSGGVGLNLQNASVVINCDLPWNPAKLEQRIARAWRKNQRRAVTVINLIAENTIEHGMLASLASKMELAEGILDNRGDLRNIKLKGGRQAFLKRLEQIMTAVPAKVPSRAMPSDPAMSFARTIRERLGESVIHCDETWLPGSDTPILITVVGGSADEHRPQIEETFRAIPWRGNAPALQIIDTGMWDTLKQLSAAGMVTIHTRATRPLLPEGQPSSPPLTAEQFARIRFLRAIAEKKRRAAGLLLTEDLAEEAATLNRAADHAEACARAIETGQPEPVE